MKETIDKKDIKIPYATNAHKGNADEDSLKGEKFKSF